MLIAAFADSHLGSYAKKLDPCTGLNARLLDCVASLRFVTCDAEERGAEAILFAGDLFRHAKPTPTELQRAIDATRSNLPIQMLVGNHDMPRAAGEETALALFGELGRHVYDKPTLVDYHDYQLAALPYPNRAQLAAALPDFDKLSPEDADRLIGSHVEQILRGLAAQLDASRPSILLAHLSIDVAQAGAERGIMAGRDITIPLTAIPEEFTFACFGHIHYAQDFGQYGRPNVFYCGSTDRIDFGEEGEEKSYVLMDLEAGTWERIPIECRRYKTVTVDMVEDWDDYRPEEVDGTICRIRVRRAENQRPDYEKLASGLPCFDFRGFVEDVQRVAAVRSEEIVRAQTLGELLGVWHEAKGCELSLDELTAAGEDLERQVA